MIDLKDIEFGGINEEYDKILGEALEHNQKLVNSAGRTAELDFSRVAGEALREVESGRKTAEQAVKEATAQFTQKGVLNVTYESGRRMNIKSALAMNVRTTSKNAALANSLSIGEQIGADAWEVSAHNDCADDHLWLNGLVVDADDEKTLGEVIEALQRPNCRHFLSPFLKGFSQKTDYGLDDEETIRKNYAQRQAKKRAENEKSKAALQRYAKAFDALKLEEGFAGKSIEQVEQIIRKRDVETMVAFDKNGKALFSKKDDVSIVHLSSTEKTILRNFAVTVTHNHPVGSNMAKGGTFSIVDLSLLKQIRVAHLRVVDKWEKYSLSLTEDSDLSDIENIYHRYEQEQLNELYKQISPEDMSHDDYAFMLRRAYDFIILEVAKECGIIYKKVG